MPILRRILTVLIAAAALSAVACNYGSSTPSAVGSPAAGTPEPIASTAATPTAQLPVVAFVHADGTSVTLPVEVPRRSEYSIGFSGRRQLDGRGMVFYYPGGLDNVGFWMKDTHIDLAIAFVDPSGRVIEVREMKAESLEIIRPAANYEYGIEAPAGWYSQHGVRAGDQLKLQFKLPDDILN